MQPADLHGQEWQERRQSVGLEENGIAEHADPPHAEPVPGHADPEQTQHLEEP
jgi:hypothetical protein